MSSVGHWCKESTNKFTHTFKYDVQSTRMQPAIARTTRISMLYKSGTHNWPPITDRPFFGDQIAHSSCDGMGWGGWIKVHQVTGQIYKHACGSIWCVNGEGVALFEKLHCANEANVRLEWSWTVHWKLTFLAIDMAFRDLQTHPIPMSGHAAICPDLSYVQEKPNWPAPPIASGRFLAAVQQRFSKSHPTDVQSICPQFTRLKGAEKNGAKNGNLF